MRESVLLALIHIFAIITVSNQKGISEKGRRIFRSYLKRYLNHEEEEEYYSLFENNLEFYLTELKSINLTDLRDENSVISYQIQNVCRQVKKGLLLEERMIVFLQLLEFTTEDGVTTEEEKTILEITARTFDVPLKEYDNAVAFISGRKYDKVSPGCMMVIESNVPGQQTAKRYINYDLWHHARINGFQGNLFILHIESTNTLLMLYEGNMVLSYRGSEITPIRMFILERGVIIKGQEINPVYYSKIFKKFVSRKHEEKIVFEGYDIDYAFSRSVQGIHRMSFRIESGNLVGLMGGSGVGKSTLLNILNGKTKPYHGNIFINGHNLHTDSASLAGLIGFVPQDDLLLEELTVYQNLYFNARLCFGNYDEDHLNRIIDKVLTDLDLQDIKYLQVGDPLNKKISGGQRKRLNIGLELMREPVILFLDEPTSGLSSFDSENVMSLLKKQALNGKLVFTIIHQPSSSVLKMFDRLWILDKGGYMVYDGDPVEALVYLKTETALVNAAESECPKCGNIETDDILEIIESKVIEDSGQEGKERMISPQEWYEKYKTTMMPALCLIPEKSNIPPSDFKVPGKREQFRTFIKRNIARKFSDKQYITLNILEAPVLALILGFISKSSINDKYIFASNENYYIFLFMAIIVSLFIGLTVSAFEIFRDRNILEREKFLNISRSSYLFSKTIFLFGLSAIQTFLFLIVANSLLEVKGMFFQQWIILFSTACFGNLLGLNISSGMKTSDSIYILIPSCLFLCSSWQVQ